MTLLDDLRLDDEGEYFLIQKARGLLERVCRDLEEIGRDPVIFVWAEDTYVDERDGKTYISSDVYRDVLRNAWTMLATRRRELDEAPLGGGNLKHFEMSQVWYTRVEEPDSSRALPRPYRGAV